jgi:hypothetical protein
MTKKITAAIVEGMHHMVSTEDKSAAQNSCSDHYTTHSLEVRDNVSYPITILDNMHSPGSVSGD